MKKSYSAFFMIWFSLVRASSNAILKTHVVSLLFCESNLLPADKMGKKTLEDVHTYAELKDDPRASFPESFTVCSTIMFTGCKSSHWPIFFNILDKNGDQLLAPFLVMDILTADCRQGLTSGTWHKK